jgi:hypothetical protein
MLIIIGIISFVLPVFFNIFFSFLRQQSKIYALSQVKREGDYILNTITNTIRNYGISIHSTTPADESNKIVCETEKSILNNYFLDKYGSYFRFCKSSTGTTCDGTDNYIASYSSKLNPNVIPLNTSKVKIANFSLSCLQSSIFSPPTIKISFVIEYNILSSRPENYASMNYQTQIKMKSY